MGDPGTSAFICVRNGLAFLDTDPQAADILIEGDRILEVGPNLRCPDGTMVIDATGHLVLPGLINAHTHAHNNLVKGSEGVWTLEDHLNGAPAQMHGRSAEEQYLSAVIGAIEMVRTGCTSAYDLFLELPAPSQEGAEAVVRAYADVGMRAVLAPAVTDIVFQRTVPGLLDLLPEDLRRPVEALSAAPATALLDISRQVIRRWDGHDRRIHVGVAPSIPGQCSEELLAGCVNLARDYGVGLHTHLCETRVQAVHGWQRWGTSVVEHLSEIGALGSRFVGAHAIWLSRDDVNLLGAAGASVAHNAASNLRLGGGIAPVREMVAAGVNVGLGSDGSATSDTLNMLDAMRLTALVSRIRRPYAQDEWLDAAGVLRMATMGSAKVLGLGDLGEIAPGKIADLVLLDRHSIALTPLNDPVTGLVFCLPGGVRTVIVGGRVVLHEDRILTVDEASIRRRAQAAADRLRRDNEGLQRFSAALAPYLSTACQAAFRQPLPVEPIPLSSP